jgi:hypothetical protein
MTRHFLIVLALICVSCGPRFVSVYKNAGVQPTPQETAKAEAQCGDEAYQPASVWLHPCCRNYDRYNEAYEWGYRSCMDKKGYFVVPADKDWKYK